MSKDWINQSRKDVHNYLEGYFPENKGRIQDAARHSAVNKKAHFWRPLMAIASGKAWVMRRADRRKCSCSSQSSRRLIKALGL